MFKNLTEYESDVPGFIQFIDDTALEKRLTKAGLKRDTEFKKRRREEGNTSVQVDFQDGSLVLDEDKASLILVRSCEICWSCGQCGHQQDLLVLGTR